MCLPIRIRHIYWAGTLARPYQLIPSPNSGLLPLYGQVMTCPYNHFSSIKMTLFNALRLENNLNYRIISLFAQNKADKHP